MPSSDKEILRFGNVVFSAKGTNEHAEANELQAEYKRLKKIRDRAEAAEEVIKVDEYNEEIKLVLAQREALSATVIAAKPKKKRAVGTATSATRKKKQKQEQEQKSRGVETLAQKRNTTTEKTSIKVNSLLVLSSLLNSCKLFYSVGDSGVPAQSGLKQLSTHLRRERFHS
jgi:hypothetical protein